MSSDQRLAALEPGDEVLDGLAPEEAPSVAPTLWQRLWGNPNAAITLVAIAVFAFFSLTTGTFLTEFNLINILRNAALIGIVAVGMTYLLIGGEIDLSVGSVFGFLTVIMGLLVVVLELSPWLAMVLVIALGAVTGTINGLIVTRIGIPSFIVTLAMLVAYRSAALIASGEAPLTTRGRTPFYELTGGELFGLVPWHVVWMLVIMAVGGLILARTRFGYHLYATGGNLEAARFAGIDTNRIKLTAFILTGALCGLVGALLFGYLRVAEPTTGTGFEFRVIGAVIVGGVALSGGRGTIYGSLMGALIISMITSGLVLLGFSQDIGDIATGALIIAAGTFGLVARRATSRRLGTLG
jgi:ribose transport system permease protein